MLLFLPSPPSFFSSLISATGAWETKEGFVLLTTARNRYVLPPLPPYPTSLFTPHFFFLFLLLFLFFFFSLQQGWGTIVLPDAQAHNGNDTIPVTDLMTGEVYFRSSSSLRTSGLNVGVNSWYGSIFQY